VVYVLCEEEKKNSLSVVKELKGDDTIYRCQMPGLFRGSCPSQTTTELNGSLVNSFATFLATLQANHVAFARFSDGFAGFAISEGFFFGQPLTKCCTVLLLLTKEESFLSRLNFKSLHTFCHYFYEGLPLVNLPRVFPGIAPGKFSRSSCSWHYSLVICKISCSD